jgi:hypothetical protein
MRPAGHRTDPTALGGDGLKRLLLNALSIHTTRSREGSPMTREREELRDWHRLFGLLLTDYFTDSPFAVEVERDLSVQQQLLDVTIVRRGNGQFAGRLPDGMEGLRPHNLLTFKSHHEALDAWTLKELSGLDVAYRKLVSPSPTSLLPDNQFGLYAVAARFPHNLSGQVPWQRVQAGVYDCRWAVDTVRVIVARELPPEPHNAPLHLFSASPELVAFGSSAYEQHSQQTSRLLRQLFEKFKGEGLTMAFTMEDFNRQYIKEHFTQLTREEQREVLQSLPAQDRVAGLPPEERLAGLPPEERLAGLTEDQIRKYLEQLSAGRAPRPRKSRRKK